jgi:hypothetical protein
VAAVRFVGDRLLFNRELASLGEERVADYYTCDAHPYLNETVNKWKRTVEVEPARYVQVMDLGFRWLIRF